VALPGKARAGQGTRLATLALLAAALVGLWQAWGLERWAIDGPGAGLWPMIVASVCVALAVIVLIWPGPAGTTEEGDTDTIDTRELVRTRSTFNLYCLALIVLAVGAAYGGFVLTSLTVSILLVRFAEGRSWGAALLYGVSASLIGLVCFAWLLRVDLPTGPIERAFLALVR
jgi:hypothetical protein